MEGVVVALVLGVALVPLVVPLFRPPLIALRSDVGPAARLRALEMRKAAIYGAISEVGFDLRTDKVEQSDYDQQIVVLKREAVEVVGEIEELKTRPPMASKKIERAIAAARKGADSSKEAAAHEAAGAGLDATAGEAPAARAVAASDEAASEITAETSVASAFCTQCGQAAREDDRFCAKCGTRLEREE